MLTLNLSTEWTPRAACKVKDLTEASMMLQKHQDEWQYGASKMDVGYGHVTDAKGKLIAEISFNGRIWYPGAKKLMAEAAWMPRLGSAL